MNILESAPTPSDIGMPECFPSWRPIQIEAINDGLAATTRFVAQPLATGSGKSLSNVTQGLIGGRAGYLCATKALQKQLLDEFESIGMVDARGRNNFQCSWSDNANTTCEDGFYFGCKAHKDGACPYVNQLNRARASQLPETNYSYWMTIHKHSDGLGPVDVLICDEASSCIDAICDMLTVELRTSEVKHLKIPPPDDDGIESWRKWSMVANAAVKLDFAKMQEKVRANPDDAGLMRQLKDLKRLQSRLEILEKSKGDWIADELRHSESKAKLGYRFDPVWPADDAEELLFLGVPRVLLTAAFINRKTCNYLGIKDEDLTFKEYPGVFDPANAPIYHIPSQARVDYRMSYDAVQNWIARIDQILRTRPNMKGIIHCVSYERQKDIYKLSSERNRFIWHNSWNTQQKLDEFKNASPSSGKVLISPAVTTGYSFADDACRFQIIAKIPMVNTQPKIMKARNKRDKEWSDYLTWQAFAQSCGRPVRNERDWCDTFVVDDHWIWWYPKMVGLGFVPKYFQRQVRRCNGIPAARVA